MSSPKYSLILLLLRNQTQYRKERKHLQKTNNTKTYYCPRKIIRGNEVNYFLLDLSDVAVDFACFAILLYVSL